MKIQIKSAFVGLSHVGLVTSSCWASLGNYVVGFDTDKKLIANLNYEKLPVFEPGLEELLKKNKKSFSFSTDFSKIKDYKLVFITHDTELTGKNRLRKLNLLVDKTIPHLANGTTLILMSQVPVGYCRKLSEKIEKSRPGLKFELIHWIDTIIMTLAIQSFLEPTRITLGFGKKPYVISDQLKNALKFFNCPVVQANWESAEITKAATNLYLANSISFANTISDFCEATGGDMNEVISALRLDKRIGQFAYIKPSLRIAGGHLERDLDMFKKLSQEKKISSGVLKYISNLNEKRYLWVVKKLHGLFPEKKKINICLWGLAYKKNSDSTLNAPSLKLIETLSKTHKLTVYDPLANLHKNFENTVQVKDKYKALKSSDCLIIVTEWDEFSKINFKKMDKLMRNRNIIDCVGILANINIPQQVKYLRMGKG